MFLTLEAVIFLMNFEEGLEMQTYLGRIVNLLYVS